MLKWTLTKISEYSSALAGSTGLEVCGSGAGQDLSVGIPHCICAWHHPHLYTCSDDVPEHTPTSFSMRHPELQSNPSHFKREYYCTSNITDSTYYYVEVICSFTALNTPI